MPAGTPPSDLLGVALRRGVTRLLLAAATGLSVAAALGLLGEFWWVFDLLAHPRLQYSVLLAATAGGLALVGRGRPAVVVVLIAIANGVVVAPLFLDKPAESVAGGPVLTVVSFNVQVRNPDRDAVIQWVGDLDADVVFLWETSQPWRDEFTAAGLPYFQSEPLQEGTTIGGLVLTRDPARVRLLETGERSSIEVVVPFGDVEAVILGAHPFPPMSGRRSAERDAQLTTIAAYADDVDGPLIVTGDLNSTPWSAAFRPLGEGLTNSMNGFGWQPSYPAGSGPFMLPIDHLLHNEYLTTVARSVGPDLGSDHLPIIVTLAAADR
ncbi:MAG: endonuclease/exonuclease/phosphatase family protein [Acidimicrobiia bacterium]|nr:endonuclease/exonuclease/phosphatase family protein [Acidimicrobiia bacterium]